MSSLILPGNPLFAETLLKRPPDWMKTAESTNGNLAYVVDHETGLLRTVSDRDLDEYLYGGEYSVRLNQMGLTDDWEFLELPENPTEMPEEFLQSDEIVHLPY